MDRYLIFLLFTFATFLVVAWSGSALAADCGRWRTLDDISYCIDRPIVKRVIRKAPVVRPMYVKKPLKIIQSRAVDTRTRRQRRADALRHYQERTDGNFRYTTISY